MGGNNGANATERSWPLRVETTSCRRDTCKNNPIQKSACGFSAKLSAATYGCCTLLQVEYSARVCRFVSKRAAVFITKRIASRHYRACTLPLCDERRDARRQKHEGKVDAVWPEVEGTHREVSVACVCVLLCVYASRRRNCKSKVSFMTA